MSSWHAIIPLNLGQDCKTRLADVLSASARHRLVCAMAQHVIDTVSAAPGIAAVTVMSPEPPATQLALARAPSWQRDGGRGLNHELMLALGNLPADGMALIIHADLPTLSVDDIGALLAAAARTGQAIAPDRAGTGTNALALTRPIQMPPAFGAGSFARHRGMFPAAAIVERPGLALDIDIKADLDLAIAHGAPCIADPIYQARLLD